MKYNLSLKERRFLIIWMLVNLFALIVNIVPIEGRIDNVDGITVTYCFTTAGDKDKFWPFTDYLHKGWKPKSGIGYNQSIYTNGEIDRYSNFLGIFHSYDLSEFIVYSILGITIIFLPKFWK